MEHLALTPPGPRLKNNLIRQFRRPHKRTNWHEIAALSGHVPGVLGGRSQPKVSGIDTLSIVALVADEHPIGDGGSSMDFVCQPMDLDHPGVAQSIPTHNAIAIKVAGSRPFPALIRRPNVPVCQKTGLGGMDAISNHMCFYTRAFSVLQGVSLVQA